MPQLRLSVNLKSNRIEGDIYDQRLIPVLLRTPALHLRSPFRRCSWPATPFVTAAQVKELQGCDVEFDDRWLDLYQQYMRSVSAKAKLGLADLPEPESKTPSWQHQKQAFHFLREQRAGALFAEMRTGKTKVVIDLICDQKAERVLVVCPKSAIPVWPKEVAVHAAFPLSVVKLDGSIVSRVEALKQPIAGPTMFVTNFEAMVQPVIQRAVDGVVWDLVVVDEAHRIKSVTGKTSIYLARLGRKVPRLLALTGTPAADKPTDIFGIYRFLDPGIFGLNYNQFYDRFVVSHKRKDRKGNIFKEFICYQNIEEMHREMYQIAFRVTQDILDLPPVQDVLWPVDLSPKTRKLYDRLERDATVAIEEEDVVSTNILTQLLRLQELTSGYAHVEGDRGERTVRLSGEKGEALAELIEDLPEDEPVVVFCRFHMDLDEIHAVATSIGRDFFELSGRKNELDDWQHRGGVLAVQIQAGGAGINLANADIVIYFSHTFSLTDYQQSRSRVLHAGKHRPVSYYHLIATGTIDEHIFQALQGKKKVVDHLVDELRCRAPH